MCVYSSGWSIGPPRKKQKNGKEQARRPTTRCKRAREKREMEKPCRHLAPSLRPSRSSRDFAEKQLHLKSFRCFVGEGTRPRVVVVIRRPGRTHQQRPDKRGELMVSQIIILGTTTAAHVFWSPPRGILDRNNEHNTHGASAQHQNKRNFSG